MHKALVSVITSYYSRAYALERLDDPTITRAQMFDANEPYLLSDAFTCCTEECEDFQQIGGFLARDAFNLAESAARAEFLETTE